MVTETITSSEMRAVETNAEYYGISLLQLMETAGRNVAEEIASRFNPKKTKIAIFCGSGGNGGDGFVAARYLTCLGFKVEIILATRASSIAHESAKKNYVTLKPLRDLIPVREVRDSLLIPEVKADVVVDTSWNRTYRQTTTTNHANSGKNQQYGRFSSCCGCSYRNKL
jgi:NAD(P)H-hydrate epimerase